MVSPRFMSSMTTISTDSNTLSTVVGWEVDKRFVRYLLTTPAVFSTPIRRTPPSSVSPSIWFFFFLWLALLWKNLVFLSLAGSYIALECCRQKTSSWCSSSVISALFFWICSRLFAYPRLIRVSTSFCFSSILTLVLPKVVWLYASSLRRQCFIFSKSLNIGLPLCGCILQVSLITFSQSWCATHLSSKRWCLLFWFCLGWVVKSIGSWSE